MSILLLLQVLPVAVVMWFIGLVNALLFWEVCPLYVCSPKVHFYWFKLISKTSELQLYTRTKYIYFLIYRFLNNCKLAWPSTTTVLALLRYGPLHVLWSRVFDDSAPHIWKNVYTIVIYHFRAWIHLFSASCVISWDNR